MVPMEQATTITVFFRTSAEPCPFFFRALLMSVGTGSGKILSIDMERK